MIPARIEFPKVIDNPGDSAREIYIINPLTIRVNSPSVNKIAGREKITMTGLIIEFTKEKIKPASA